MWKVNITFPRLLSLTSSLPQQRGDTNSNNNVIVNLGLLKCLGDEDIVPK